jgi:hypothetical protein
MVEIGRALVSIDIFRECFLCDLEKCKGACCIEGDSGAPLAAGEEDFITLSYPHFKDYLSAEHQLVISENGYAVIDREGDQVTPLVNNRQCAYSYTDEAGILKCAIEKAKEEGSIDFKKPLSCHLFPVRIVSYRKFDAVNYEKIDVCRSARECGLKLKVPLYRFLKEPLIRKYGQEWYQELVNIGEDKNFRRKIRNM